MRNRSVNRGSALLIAIVVTMMVLGIGGAFLAETVFRSKEQHNSIRSDEAQVILEAGLEKSRRALWRYRDDFLDSGGTAGWSWDNILTYCRAVETTYYGGAGNGTNLTLVRNNYDNVRKTSSDFTSYMSAMSSSGTHTNPLFEAPIPANRTTPASMTAGTSPSAAGMNSTDASAQRVFLGWNTPYMEGAFHVMVRDNEDGDGIDEDADGDVGDVDGDDVPDPLVDTDQRVFLVCTATLPDGTQRQVEVLVRDPRQAINAVAVAAVSAQDIVATLGNITIDGRDWDIDNTVVVGPGQLGVASKNDISIGGSSQVGGNGAAPSGTEVEGVNTNQDYVDGVDGPALPTSADQALGLADGTLKQIAQQNGTYFTTQEQYDAYVDANGGNLPGGQVYYLEGFNPGNPTRIGDAMNSTPSIFVNHGPGNSAVAKNLHGNFKGIMLLDSVDKVNSGTNILGAVYTFSTANPDTFGNGSAYIRFSSAVLLNLPSLASTSLEVLAYRKLK